jgi:hypothetical protein
MNVHSAWIFETKPCKLTYYQAVVEAPASASPFFPGIEMTNKKFTVREANGILPRVERTLGRLFQMRQKLNQIQRELRISNAAPEKEDFEVLIEDASMGVVNRRAALKSLLEAIDEEIENLSNFGAILKDIDEGLVDFQAHEDGRDIHLCWQVGEPEVTHWHHAEESCSTRSTLSQLDPDTDLIG